MPDMLADGYDGFFVDTTRATVPGARGSELVEYPSSDPERWMRDMQMAMARVKIALPDSVMTANGWHATPFVLDGAEDEGWLNITKGLSGIESALRSAIALDRRGKIQLLQYNPIYEPERAAFGPKVPITLDRDAIFGLAAYYLCAGDHTYYGYGRHPYGYATTWYNEAADFDIGEPVYLFEIDVMALLPFVSEHRLFQPIPRYPATVRDIALIVDTVVTHQQAVDIIKGFSLVKEVAIFDVYSGKQVPAGKKSLAYRIAYQSPAHTLTDEEVNKVQERILKRLSQELGATLRG
jgi:hypothetical protein